MHRINANNYLNCFNLTIITYRNDSCIYLKLGYEYEGISLEVN